MFLRGWVRVVVSPLVAAGETAAFRINGAQPEGL